MVVLGDRADLEAGGKRRVGDRLAERPDHHESVSHSLVALGLEQRDPAEVPVVHPGPERVRFGARPICRGLASALLRPPKQGAADAAAALIGQDPAVHLVERNLVADGDVRLGQPDELAVDLRCERVPSDVEVRAVNKIVAEIVDRRHPVHVVGEMDDRDELDDRRQIAVEIDRPKAEAGDGRRVRRPDLHVRIGSHRVPPVTGRVRTSLPCARSRPFRSSSSGDAPPTGQAHRLAARGVAPRAPASSSSRTG